MQARRYDHPMQRLLFGPFVFECARGVLLRDGRPVPVNQRGIRLLGAMLRTPGEAVSKTVLMDAAWPGTAASLAMEFMGFSGPEVQEGLAALKGKRRPKFDREGPVLRR